MRKAISMLCAAGSLLVVGVPAVGVLGASLTGCAFVGLMGPTFKASKDASVPHEKDKPLYVIAENGAIEIVQTDGDKVLIHADIQAKTQERADKAEIIATRDKDGALHVSLKWPDGKAQSNEGCALVVKVPDAAMVRAKTTNGGITCRGVGTSADLSTENGAIKVWNLPGDVKARTTNGNIELHDVPGAQAATTNGSVSVTLFETPRGSVSCETTNGSVTLFVPPAFNQSLDCQTTNGSVKCDAPGAKTTQSGKTHAAIVFGAGEHKGSLETTNGSVYVKAKDAEKK